MENIAYGCYSSDYFPNEPLCDLFERNVDDGGLNNFINDYINIASQFNSGYDLAINYDLDLSIGELRLESRHTYQEKDTIALTPDNVINPNGRFGDPRLTATFRASLDRDDWTYSWNVRYVGSVSHYKRDGGDMVTIRGVPSRIVNTSNGIFYHSFSVATTYNDDLRLLFGVANAFDQDPPNISTVGTYASTGGGGNAAFYSQYDWRGRRFFANVTYEF